MIAFPLGLRSFLFGCAFRVCRRARAVFCCGWAVEVRHWAFKAIFGDAHGHGPLVVTPGERAPLSVWMKQGRDCLVLQRKADLLSLSTDFLPEVRK
jgi:hypothetical protein